jgi:hypothetical protein
VTVTLTVGGLALIGGLFCIVLAGDFWKSTPADMTRDQARTAVALLILVGGLLVIGVILLTPLAVKHWQPRSTDGETLPETPASVPVLCRFCSSKSTQMGLKHFLGMNPIWKIYLLLFSFSLPLVILIFHVPTLFEELSHAKGDDQLLGELAMTIALPVGGLFVFGTLAHVLGFCVERVCPSCKARWPEKFSFGAFWHEVNKGESH